MYTNQSADPAQLQLPPLACHHAPGEGTAETCAYLRVIERVRAWADRAELAQHEGRSHRLLLGELFLLFAEAQGTHDLCPDHVALVELH